MTLTLDPRIPLLWRDPHSLQFGTAPPLAFLDEVSPVQERMLAALQTGATPEGLLMLAGGDHELCDGLLTKLAAVLMPASQPAEPVTVAVLGTGPTAELVTQALGGAGIRALLSAACEADALGREQPALVIAVGQFVLPPTLGSQLLRRDLPHLPVLFDEAGAVVGPLVQPGLGACLRCVELALRDADPARPALASQLLGRRAAAQTPLLTAEAAALAVRTGLALLRGAAPAAVSVRIDAQTGRHTQRAHQPHPECGCLELPVLSGDRAAAPPRSDWARGEPADRGRRWPTTTGAVPAAPA